MFLGVPAGNFVRPATVKWLPMEDFDIRPGNISESSTNDVKVAFIKKEHTITTGNMFNVKEVNSLIRVCHSSQYRP